MLFKAIWLFDGSHDFGTSPLPWQEILGVQVIGIFLLLVNVIEDIVYCAEIINIVNYVTNNKLKLLIANIIYGLQVLVSLASTFIFFMGVIKGNEPLSS